MPILLFIWCDFRVMWYKILPFAYKILPFVVQSPPPCGIKSPPMWYNLCLHATSRTNPEPIPKEGEAMKSHENKPKNDLERPKIHLNPINFTVFRPKTIFAFFTPIPLSGVFYSKTDFLNSPSGLTPVIFETKANIKGKYEQSRT